MTKLEKIRQAVADYMYSEGCTCCQNIEAHAEAKARVAELLGVPKYKDDSGYDFSSFRSSVNGTVTPKEKS